MSGKQPQQKKTITEGTKREITLTDKEQNTSTKFGKIRAPNRQ